MFFILGVALSFVEQSISKVDKVTDANYDEFHFNPGVYVTTPINITGKIFNVISPSQGISGFQIHQLGDSDRLLFVGYEMSIHQNFREGECVNIGGNIAGSTTSHTVLATSIKKINCDEMIILNSKIANLEQTQESD
jgi:hypothetical protein